MGKVEAVSHMFCLEKKNVTSNINVWLYVTAICSKKKWLDHVDTYCVLLFVESMKNIREHVSEVRLRFC